MSNPNAQSNIDASSLVHGATKVRQVKDDVSGDLDRLRNVITDLAQRGWRGAAADGFMVVMTSWDGSVKKLMIAMEEIAKLLDKSQQHFTMTEREREQSITGVRDYTGALGGSGSVRGPR